MATEDLADVHPVMLAPWAADAIAGQFARLRNVQSRDTAGDHESLDL